MNPTVTARDLSLIRYLSDEGVATREQLQARFFPSSKACYQRLHTLMQLGLIRSVPATSIPGIEEVLSLCTFEETALNGWIPGNMRLYCLSDRIQPFDSRRAALAVSTMWKHQLCLNKVRQLFEPLFPGATFLVEPDVEMEKRSGGADASVALPDFVADLGERRIAFEMERTLKRSDDRYIQKWLSYQRQTYARVIYVCVTDGMVEYLGRLGQNFPFIGFCTLRNPYRIYRSAYGLEKVSEFLSSNIGRIPSLMARA